ncbi:MAG: hypothetical protein LM572_02450 [Ignisphaera sp.]|jgi:tRNA threonylcarbamoyladenosine modification (KEOPS) complex  Pcc1 subunit|nr:hypothetical protein [Ignisphaera sp.]MCC6055092.1 hypothetical protein [Desulfurococcaceae archaeon]
MNLELTFRIQMIYESICRAVMDSVKPDNITAPPQITIEMQCDSGMLIIKMKGENVNILTFRNTMDDLLEHISLATKIIKSSQRK